MKDNKAEIEVGLFDGLNALHSFIDDRLIYLRNSKRSRNSYFFHGDEQTKGLTKKFLEANGFDSREGNSYLEVDFSNSIKQSDTQHLFFVNTRYEQDEITEIAQKLLNERNEASVNNFIHLLNSDSYLGYYNQQKDNGDTHLVGSPASPAKMENRDARPF